MLSWPTTLPDFALQQGYAEGFRKTVQRSQIDGATKRRKRFNDGPKTLDITVPLTNAEANIFFAFYQDDLADGALSFTKTHPRLGTLETFSFRSDVEPLVAEGANSYLLTMKLELLTISFSPAQIVDLVLWLDADDSNTITASGGLVSQWNDKSGQGNTVFQSDVNEQPKINAMTLNAKPVVLFDSTDDHMGMSFLDTSVFTSDDRSIFAVIRVASDQDGSRIGNIIGNFNASPNANLEAHTDGRLRTHWNGTPSFFSGAGFDLRDNNGVVISTIRSSTANTQYINGAEAGTDSPGADLTLLKPFRIGGDYRVSFDDIADPGIPFEGAIAELMVYDRAVANSERVSLENYLSHKWGITLP